MKPILPFALVLSAATAAASDAPVAPDELDRAPFAWGATDATWRVTVPAEGPLLLDLEWRFTALRPGWLDVPLVGAGVVVQEVSGPAMATPDAIRVVLGPDRTSAVVRLRGTLDPHRPGEASLAVLPAAREQVVVDARGRDVRVAGATDGWLAAADALSLSWAPRVEALVRRPQAPLVYSEASTAVWGEPGALLTRSVVRWKVLRGALARFALDVSGLDEVEVEGPNLAGARREGRLLVLEPRLPVRGGFAVTVTGRAAITGDQSLAVPAARPLGVARVDRYWTLGRSDEAERVPEGAPAAAGIRSVAARAIPEWGRGLSDSTPIAYWQGDAALRLRPARFTPTRTALQVKAAPLTLALPLGGEVVRAAAALLAADASPTLTLAYRTDVSSNDVSRKEPGAPR